MHGPMNIKKKQNFEFYLFCVYDHKTNDYIRRELRFTGMLDKTDEYRGKWLSHL